MSMKLCALSNKSLNTSKLVTITDTDKAIAQSFIVGLPDFKAAISPIEVVLLEERTPISNQMDAGSCTANRRCDGLELVMPADKVKQLSRRACYWSSRYAHGDQDNDKGSYSHISAAVAENVGICLEEEWEYKDGLEDIIKRPSLSAFLSCARHLVPSGSIQAIRGNSKERIQSAMAALSLGYPVGIDMVVDRKFVEGPKIDEVVMPPTVSIGGHAVLLVGYEISSSGKIKFRLRNSWGTGWCDRGYCWISSDYIGSVLHVEDIDVTTLPPAGY
jgi:hypothetical protein